MLHAAIDDWLAPLGWIAANAARPDAISGLQFGDRTPALVLLDGRMAAGEEKGARWIAAVRALSGLAAGTPILLMADGAAPMCAGVAGRIDLPLDPVAARPVLEQWAGPLADHGFRDVGNPHYRLIRLAGRAQADALVKGFAEHLEDALACAGRGDPLGGIAHRIAGLSGLVGFGELTPLWSLLDRDESADPASALHASRAVLEAIRCRFPPE